MRIVGVCGLVLLLLYSCGENDNTTVNTGVVSNANSNASVNEKVNITIKEFTLTNNNNASAPLVALFSLTTVEPVRVRLVLEDGSEPWTVALSDELASSHQAVILGLHVSTEYNVTAIVTNAAGEQMRSQPVVLRTVAYPDDFPGLEVKTSVVAQMEPGVTLFNLFRWQADNNGQDQDFGALLAVDEQGEVVWFYRSDHEIEDARMLASGNILYSKGRYGVAYEIDMLGNLVAQWHASGTNTEAPSSSSIAVATDTFHHEMIELPSGNLLTLSSEIRAFDDYRTSPTDATLQSEPAHLVGDKVVEFSRDGQVVRELNLLDILDPYRYGSANSFSGAFWDEPYEGIFDGEKLDWGHTNALFYAEQDNAYLLSVRRQDAIIKVDASSGELQWILGIHDRWETPWKEKLLKPVGEIHWPNHQHAIKKTPQNTYLMYDNGSNREDVNPDAARFSRAVEYAVDEQAMEVREIWSYGGRPGEEFFSSFISDADYLPATGNILITDGGRIRDEDGNDASGFSGHRWARLLEVTHTTPAEIVFELVIDDDSGLWHVYRAQRLSSLYGR